MIDVVQYMQLRAQGWQGNNFQPGLGFLVRLQGERSPVPPEVKAKYLERYPRTVTVLDRCLGR